MRAQGRVLRVSQPVGTRETGKPVILRVEAEGVYSLSEPDAGLEFRADYLRRDSRTGEITGELSVSCSEHAARVDNLLSVASFNFSSAQARASRAKLIKERGGKELAKVSVAECLEAFCQYISQQERTGEPAVVLRDVPSRRPEDSTFEVLGIRLPLKHLAILFGAPGALKSLLALYIAYVLTTRGLRVCYIDWELDAADHRHRLGQFSPDIPDSLLYRRCRKPLVQEIDSLRRIGKAERIDYYILDSVGYGTAGDPAAADAALDFCRAVGQLGTGSLALAHITKNGENNDQMPYGSMFWHASARSTFFLKLATEDSDTPTVGVFNRKSNLTRRQPPIGLRVRFEGEQTTFERTDLGDVQELAGSLPKWQRVASILRAGPQTVAALANELGEAGKVDALDRYIRRYDRLFTKVKSRDGITRVALLEGRAA
jgi:hypothetical protein